MAVSRLIRPRAPGGEECDAMRPKQLKPLP